MSSFSRQPGWALGTWMNQVPALEPRRRWPRRMTKEIDTGCSGTGAERVRRECSVLAEAGGGVTREQIGAETWPGCGSLLVTPRS